MSFLLYSEVDNFEDKEKTKDFKHVDFSEWESEEESDCSCEEPRGLCTSASCCAASLAHFVETADNRPTTDENPEKNSSSSNKGETECTCRKSLAKSCSNESREEQEESKNVKPAVSSQEPRNCGHMISLKRLRPGLKRVFADLKKPVATPDSEDGESGGDRMNRRS